MKLLVQRTYRGPIYTIGKLYIDGQYFCDTIERRDLGLRQEMTLQEILRIKVPGQTAIPYGTYRVLLSFSEKFERSLPFLQDVPGFAGIMIHTGNTEKDSRGCIIVGENKAKGMVLNSKKTMEKLLARLRGQTNIEITIK